jgi:hypothetical protein
MRPTSWVDAEVAVAWCRFVNLMDERHAPEDVMKLLTEVDHALLSEAVTQYASPDVRTLHSDGWLASALRPSIKRKRH